MESNQNENGLFNVGFFNNKETSEIILTYNKQELVRLFEKLNSEVKSFLFQSLGYAEGERKARIKTLIENSDILSDILSRLTGATVITNGRFNELINDRNNRHYSDEMAKDRSIERVILNAKLKRVGAPPRDYKRRGSRMLEHEKLLVEFLKSTIKTKGVKEIKEELLKHKDELVVINKLEDNIAALKVLQEAKPILCEGGEEEFFDEYLKFFEKW